jgi:4-methylaminobutanoate oxidase (formaldehyde-forming)
MNSVGITSAGGAGRALAQWIDQGFPEEDLWAVDVRRFYSWGRQNWFHYAAAEHMAVRENVGIYDLSSMAKFLLQGRDALQVLQYLCCNSIDVPVGKVVYTQMLNERGGIEADLTVTRMAADKFFIVTPGATGMRDHDWIQRHISDDAFAAGL